MIDPSVCPYCGSNKIQFHTLRKEQICQECGSKSRDNSEYLEKTKNPLKIFLSYGHDIYVKDALQIKIDLEIRGHDVWFDLERINEGSDWEQYIEEGLKDCDRVVLIMTPHSVRRRKRFDPSSTDGYCLNELAKALQRNKIIIPILLVELEEGPPASICRIQYLDLRDVVPIHEHKDRYFPRFQRLLMAIEDQNLNYEGGQARLQKVLKPIDFENEINLNIARFTGRQWLLNEIDKWLKENKESRVFWVVGSPGIGKTTFVAHLCHYHKHVIGYHFCVHGQGDKGDPRRAILSIVYQLAQYSPEYDRRLQNLNLEEEVTKNTKTLFENLFVRIFKNDFPEPEMPCLVVIDAIDEATQRGRNEIAEFIHDYWHLTPDWLRLIITSRPESPILSSLGRLTPFILDTKSENNFEDIRKYIINELQKRNIPVNEDAVKKIVVLSEGIFLYIIEIFKELDQGKLLLSDLDKFPIGLTGIYQRFFYRQFPDIVDYKNKIRPIVECICAQLEPIPLSLLNETLEISNYELLQRLAELGAIYPIKKYSMGSSISEEYVIPFHKSINDWLIEKDTNSGYFIAGIYAADKDAGEIRLTKACWEDYLNGPHSMHNYSVRHLATHLKNRGQPEKILKLLTDADFIEEKIMRFGPYQMISDYEFETMTDRLSNQLIKIKKLKSLSLIKGALRLSAHVLARDPFQVRGQLIGRLMGNEDPQIQKFIEQLKNNSKKSWLYPIQPTLAIPEGCQIFTLMGHSGPIWDLSISRNQQILISASLDSNLIIWNLESGIQRHVLEGHKNWINCVVITSDNKRAISGSSDTTLKVWDLETGTAIYTLSGHTKGVNCVVITSDNKRAISGSSDTTLKVWDLETGTAIYTLSGHISGIRCMGISSDNNRIFSGTSDGSIKMWDLQTGIEQQTFKGHSDVITALVVTHDNQWIVSASLDSTIKLWDIKTGKLRYTLNDHKAEIRSLILSKDGGKIISGSGDSTIKIWDLNQGVLLDTFDAHSLDVTKLVLMPDGSRVISGSAENSIKVWDLQCGYSHPVCSRHSDAIKKIIIIQNENKIISASYDSNLIIWDAITFKKIFSLNGHTDKINDFSVTPDGKTAVSASSDGTLRIWNLENGKEKNVLQGNGSEIKTVTVTSDGKSIISGSSDSTLKIWDLELGSEKLSLKGHTSGINAILITSDGKYAATGSQDTTIKIWDLESGAALCTKVAHTRGIKNLAITPDGKKIISSSSGLIIKIWDLLGETPIRDMMGHLGIVTSLAVSPDGERLLSGSIDQTIRVWDVGSGKEIAILNGHNGPITKIIISSNGKIAFSSSSDCSIKVWDLEIYKEITCFDLENSITSINLDYHENYLVAGDCSGKLHFLQIVNCFPQAR
jgi:WD40 repeat protein